MATSQDWIDKYPGVRALLQDDEALLDACAEDALPVPRARPAPLVLGGPASRAIMQQQQYTDAMRRAVQQGVAHTLLVPRVPLPPGGGLGGGLPNGLGS